MKKADNIFQMLELGDLDLNEVISQAFVMMGLTRRGKTTLGHYLCGQPLRSIKQEFVKYKQATNTFANCKIGTTFNSQTQIPNIFKIDRGKTILIDCPGFMDTYGAYRIITNAYFNYRVFSKVQKMKFILVFERNDIANTASNFIQTVKCFMDNFIDFGKKLDQLMNSTVFVVTKVNEPINTIKNIITTLLKNFQSPLIEKNRQEDFKKFITFIVQKDRIFIFKQAQENTFLPANTTLLKEIGSSIQFWKRQAKNQIVDMSEISFSILKHIKNNNSQNNDEKQIFSQLMSSFTNRIKDVTSNGIKQVFSALFKDSFGDNNDRSTFDIMNKFQKQRQQFFIFLRQPQANKRKSIKQKLFLKKNTESLQINNDSSIFWIRKMKLCQIIYNQILVNSDKQVSRSYQNIVNNQLIFMKLIQKFYMIIRGKNQIMNVIANYGYIIYRLFEEAKIFFLIMSMDDPIKKQLTITTQFFDFDYPMKQTIDGIFDKNFQEQKRKYALKFEIPQGLPRINYQDILSFYKSINQGDIQNEKKILRSKIAKLNILIANGGGEKYEKSPSQIIKDIIGLNEVRLDLYYELKDNQSNELNKQKSFILFQTMNTLGQLLGKIQSYDLSIKCYDSVFNIAKVIEIYKKYIQKQININKKKKILLNLSEYAQKNLRFQVAIEALQQVYGLSANNQQIQVTSEAIFMLGSNILQNQNSKSIPYLQSMMNKKVYKLLSFNDESDISILCSMQDNFVIPSSPRNIK